MKTEDNLKHAECWIISQNTDIFIAVLDWNASFLSYDHVRDRWKKNIYNDGYNID